MEEKSIPMDMELKIMSVYDALIEFNKNLYQFVLFSTYNGYKLSW